MSGTRRSYTQTFLKVEYIIIKAILGRKLMKNLRSPMKKYSLSIRVLTEKNNSHMDLRTSQVHLSEKGCRYGEEDSKNRFCHKKSTLPL